MMHIDKIKIDFEIKLISAFDEVYGYPVNYKKWIRSSKICWTFFTLGDNWQSSCVFRVIFELPPHEDPYDAYPVILIEWSISSEDVMKWDWGITYSALTTHLVNPIKPIKFLKEKMDQLLLETGHKNIYRG